MSYNFSKLTLGILTAVMASNSFAAGLDRSGQDTSAFLQDGTYVESVYTYIDADVTGKDNAKIAGADYTEGKEINDIAQDYDFFRFGVKADVNDRISVGVLYTEPWGASVQYSGDNNFVSKEGDADGYLAANSGGKINSLATLQAAIQTMTSGAQEAGLGAQKSGIEAKKFADEAAVAQAAGEVEKAKELGTKAAQAKRDAEAFIKTAEEAKVMIGRLVVAGATASALDATKGEATSVEIRSNSLTGIVGVKLGENKNLQLYGGPVAERIFGDMSLRGSAYGGSTGYDAYIAKNTDYGWLAGIAYHKPEIGLKAALTYRSEIEHDLTVTEFVPVRNSLLSGDKSTIDNLGMMTINTPESFNFDFQTGINPTTLATAKVRFVPWSKFTITPPEYNSLTRMALGDDVGLPITDYSDDQINVELGLAKRLNKKLAVSGTVGWDSGAGNPLTSLGPVEGYYSAGLGAKLNITDTVAISAGGKYLMFGDAKASLPDNKIVGDFVDNEGFVAGIKLSYQQ